MNDNEQAPQQPATEPTFEVMVPEKPAEPQLRHEITLPNLWRVWISLKSTAAHNSVLLYEHVARKFCKFFDADSPHKLDPEGMVAWMRHLQEHRTAYFTHKPLSAVRINKINFVVKAFLRWMRLMKYVDDDLAACIPHLMEPARRDPAIITEEEYEALKKYCAGRNWCQTHLWLIILGYRTGMSLVDCCHLRWRDVHLDDNGPSYIDIYRIKLQRLGDKAKCQIPIVPFSDLHLWLLNLRKAERWKRADGIDDYVHQETQGLYVTTMGNLRGDFKRIFERAGLPKGKSFKCFRNSLCSNLVNSGMQLALVCKVTGHNSVKMLLRYLKPDRRALQDGMAKAQQYSALKAGTGGKGTDGLQDGAEAYL